MIAWLTTLGLRAKLIGLAIGGVLLSIGYLYVRWKIAAKRATTATAKAERLEETHEAEVKIEAKRDQLAEKQRKVRAEIAKATKRDYFEQGWGP